ncbi:MAG: CPBP family intramembrane glutamic endopeptidase [Bacillota bacterium]
MIRRAFINRCGQIRSGWKILIILLSSVALTLVFFFIGDVILSLLLTNEPEQLLKLRDSLHYGAFLQTAAVIVTLLIVLKFIDKKTVGSIGLGPLAPRLKDLFGGLLFGAASMTAVFIILIITGGTMVTETMESQGINLSIVYGLIPFILVALSEELLFRGYIINALQQMGKIRVSLALSSIIFALVHGVNPNVNFLGLSNIFLVGLLFSYMYIKTGSLWMPIGYHFTWNYFQGVVYGFPVSGHELESLYRLPVQENIIAGGKFGPEGGLAVTGVILLSLLVMRYRLGIRN